MVSITTAVFLLAASCRSIDAAHYTPEAEENAILVEMETAYSDTNE